MTSSTRYGFSDRRRKTQAEEIRVKHAIDAVYADSGYREDTKASNDPENRVVMEKESRRRALAHLPVKDRTMINACTQRLKECCPGCNFGDGAAMQVLMHIGIFLSLAGKN